MPLKDKKIIKYEEKKQLKAQVLPKFLVYSENFEALGQGNYGTVYKCHSLKADYTLKRLNYINKGRVVKVFFKVDEQLKQDINKEYAIGKMTPHLGMKQPVFRDNTCYLLMNQFPGKDLLDLHNTGALRTLNLNQKLELSYKLLVALRDQVTHCGIVHRDIKPENIIVQLEPEIRVNIIDFGIAKKANDHKDNKAMGTPNYAAPEVLKEQPYDAKCDVFSLGKTMALLWITNKGLICYRAIDETVLFINANYLSQSLERFKDDDLKKNDALWSLLKTMLLSDPLQRCTIDEAIQSMENAYPDLKQNTTTSPQSVQSTHAKIQRHIKLAVLEDMLKSYSPQEVSLAKYQFAIQKIGLQLERLNRYAQKIHNKYPEDAKTIQAFTAEFEHLLNSNAKPETIQQQCQNLLSQDNINNCANHHEKVLFILKNIGAALIGLGVVYAVALIANKMINGRFGFFHNEIIQTKDNIEAQVAAIPGML